MVRGGARIFRLAAVDLDGTLLASDGTVSDRTRAALHDVSGRGVDVVIVSARGPRGVLAVADRIGIDGIAICSNGAIVLDLATREVTNFRPLETEVARQIVAALRERYPGTVFAVERDVFAHEPGFAAWDWEPPPGTRVADALELLADAPAKLIIRHEQHALDVIAEAVREIAGGTAFVTIPGTWTVEVSAAGVNKATALTELCEARGIPPEQVIAFGDYLNDVPMLAWAGRAVAVENAHPDVVAIADELTTSNDDDGVARVLERLG